MGAGVLTTVGRCVLHPIPRAKPAAMIADDKIPLLRIEDMIDIPIPRFLIKVINVSATYIGNIVARRRIKRVL
jgi:hypothetical protein